MSLTLEKYCSTVHAYTTEPTPHAPPHYHTDTPITGRNTGDTIMSQEQRGQWSISKQQEDNACCSTVPAHT